MSDEETKINPTLSSHENGDDSSAQDATLSEAETELLSNAETELTSGDERDDADVTTIHPKTLEREVSTQALATQETVVYDTPVSATDDTLAADLSAAVTQTAAHLSGAETQVSAIDDDSTRVVEKGKKSPEPPKQKRQILRSRFELVELLGSGGMGDVFLAKDLLKEEMQDEQCMVALKLLNENFSLHYGALQALQREAKKSQALSHPNIVTVYDFDRDNDTAFITMEYIEGVSLKQYINQNQGAVPYEKAIEITMDIAKGLAYAHQKGYVHADIKPANLFITHDDIVKVLDFGIAQAFKESVKEAPNAADELTKNALTPAYASVEMLEGQPLAPSDDVYALACVMHELLTGKHPFAGKNGRGIPAKKAKEDGLKIAPIKGVSRRHMAALRKGLAFDHKHRFQNAGEFIDALKPRNIKRLATMLLSMAIVTGGIYWAVDYSIEQVIPSPEELREVMPHVTEDFLDVDKILAYEDIEPADIVEMRQILSSIPDRFPDNSSDEAKAVAHRIWRDRLNKAGLLIADMALDVEDPRTLRVYLQGLELVIKTEDLPDKRKIEKTIKKLQKRLAK